MKRISILLLLVPILAGCSDYYLSLNQEVYFKVEYVNYAWGAFDSGFLIDSEGHVLSFDVINDSLTNWKNADSKKTISYDDMSANLNMCHKTGRTIRADSLQLYIDKIPSASTGSYSQPVYPMCDFGIITYSAYIGDNRKRIYKEILLKQYGDCLIYNNSASAKNIVLWLESIRSKSN